MPTDTPPRPRPLGLALALGVTVASSGAAAHDHWGDLDGDGLIEPDEIEAPLEVDRNDDGVISPSEEGVAEIEALDDAGVVAVEETPSELDTPEANPGPKFIRVGEEPAAPEGDPL
jgi:hypothetical protein